MEEPKQEAPMNMPASEETPSAPASE